MSNKHTVVDFLNKDGKNTEYNNVLALYQAYLDWLIKAQKTDASLKFTASELLFQINIMNNFILSKIELNELTEDQKSGRLAENTIKAINKKGDTFIYKTLLDAVKPAFAWVVPILLGVAAALLIATGLLGLGLVPSVLAGAFVTLFTGVCINKTRFFPFLNKIASPDTIFRNNNIIDNPDNTSESFNGMKRETLLTARLNYRSSLGKDRTTILANIKTEAGIENTSPNAYQDVDKAMIRTLKAMVLTRYSKFYSEIPTESNPREELRVLENNGPENEVILTNINLKSLTP